MQKIGKLRFIFPLIGFTIFLITVIESAFRPMPCGTFGYDNSLCVVLFNITALTHIPSTLLFVFAYQHNWVNAIPYFDFTIINYTVTFANLIVFSIYVLLGFAVNYYMGYGFEIIIMKVKTLLRTRSNIVKTYT